MFDLFVFLLLFRFGCLLGWVDCVWVIALRVVWMFGWFAMVGCVLCVDFGCCLFGLCLVVLVAVICWRLVVLYGLVD